METAGISGNGHMMMLEKNSADIAKYIGNWLSTERAARPRREQHRGRCRPKTIPTFATDDIARKGFFYAGGEYWGEPGRQVMRGAMYTEVLGAEADPAAESDRALPRQRADRRGLAADAGRPRRLGVPPRSRKATSSTWSTTRRAAAPPTCRCPGRTARQPIDGNLGIRTALELERIWTNARERGDFPLKMNHTQWPGTGKIGDPIFDTFIRTQVQFAGATGTLMRRRRHRAARHDRHAGDHVHPLAGRRLRVRHHRGAPEPGAERWSPPSRADRSSAAPTRRRSSRVRAIPNSWGLTNNRYEYTPPANAPAEICSRCWRRSRSGPTRCAAGCRWSRRASWRGGRTSRVLAISANGTYHRVYDPCIPKFLNQAGVQDRLRPARGRRHQRQQPHDDAREEQRRHHQVRSLEWIEGQHAARR